MSLFIYPCDWNDEEIKLADDILDLIRNSSLNMFSVCSVLNDLSMRVEGFAKRSGELFSAAEVMPRVEAEILKKYPERKGLYK